MSRPIWKGSISFGLVNIPVTLFSGEESKEIHFNLLDKRDQSHIKYKRVNETTGKEVTWENIVKGYEIEDNEYVLLDDKDFQAIAVENTKSVEITDFVDASQIDARYFEKPYYLVPAKAGEKGYVLLRDTLKKQNRVGIAKVVIRTRENLAAVIPFEDALVLVILRFAQEIKEPKDVGLGGKALESHKISDKEMEIAAQLVEAMTTEWEPERYKDDYESTLEAYVKKKYKQGDKFEVPEVQEEKPTPASDMMELLRKSLAGRGQPKPTHKEKVAS